MGGTGSQPRRGKVEREPDFSWFFIQGGGGWGGLLKSVEQTSCSCPQTSSASMLFSSVLLPGLHVCLSQGATVRVCVCVGVRGCLCACLSSIGTKALRICVQHILWTDALCFSVQDIQIYLLNRGTAQTHTHMLTQLNTNTALESFAHILVGFSAANVYIY